MNFIKAYYHYIIVILIIVASYLLYSSVFYYSLNSDDALNILMAHYYHFPNEVYYWGQNRGRGIIPLISQVFIKLFGSSAVTAVSLLIVGYCGFASLFKSKNVKLLFAIVWFLPFQRFVDITRFYIGMEYCVVGLAVWLINKLNHLQHGVIKQHLLYIATIFACTLSIWVLDTAVVTLIILLAVLFIYNRPVKRSTWIYVVAGAILCTLCIWYAKTLVSDDVPKYSTKINSWHDILRAWGILIESFAAVLAFRTNELLVSIYTYLVMVLLAAFSIFASLTSSWRKLINNKWFVFFVLDFFAFFAIYLVFFHVLANGMGRWYYVANYISLSIAILLAVDLLKEVKGIRYFRYALVLITIIGAVSPVYTIKMDYHTQSHRLENLTPTVKVVSEFERLGKIGIIAEYWNAYIASISNPDMIKATPHQDDYAWTRSRMLVERTMECENIYVIRDAWLESFPDTLYQFGHTLLRDGEEFYLGRAYVCKYKKVK